MDKFIKCLNKKNIIDKIFSILKEKKENDIDEIKLSLNDLVPFFNDFFNIKEPLVDFYFRSYDNESKIGTFFLLWEKTFDISFEKYSENLNKFYKEYFFNNYLEDRDLKTKLSETVKDNEKLSDLLVTQKKRIADTVKQKAQNEKAVREKAEHEKAEHDKTMDIGKNIESITKKIESFIEILDKIDKKNDSDEVILDKFKDLIRFSHYIVIAINKIINEEDLTPIINAHNIALTELNNGKNDEQSLNEKKKLSNIALQIVFDLAKSSNPIILKIIYTLRDPFTEAIEIFKKDISLQSLIKSINENLSLIDTNIDQTEIEIKKSDSIDQFIINLLSLIISLSNYSKIILTNINEIIIIENIEDFLKNVDLSRKIASFDFIISILQGIINEIINDKYITFIYEKKIKLFDKIKNFLEQLCDELKNINSTNIIKYLTDYPHILQLYHNIVQKLTKASLNVKFISNHIAVKGANDALESAKLEAENAKTAKVATENKVKDITAKLEIAKKEKKEADEELTAANKPLLMDKSMIASIFTVSAATPLTKAVSEVIKAKTAEEAEIKVVAAELLITQLESMNTTAIKEDQSADEKVEAATKAVREATENFNKLIASSSSSSSSSSKYIKYKQKYLLLKKEYPHLLT